MKALQFLIFFFTIALITCCNSIAKESNSKVLKDNYNVPTNITKVFNSPKAFNKDKQIRTPEIHGFLNFARNSFLINIMETVEKLFQVVVFLNFWLKNVQNRNIWA